MTEHKKHNFWVVYVVENVRDRPTRNSYQRIIALVQEFNVIVVTRSELPSVLDNIVQKVYLESKAWAIWSRVSSVTKQLQHEGCNVYVHSQYSPIQLVAGYLCKQRTGCKWVYDLWDHPALTYRSKKGIARWSRQLFSFVTQKWMLGTADAWIIAMHPAILGYLPPAPVSCKIIFTQPGCMGISDERVSDGKSKFDKNNLEARKIVYTGAINEHRLNSIVQWAKEYSGVSVELHLMGQHSDANSDTVLASIESMCTNNPNILFKYHGELPHPEALKILKNSDISICPVDVSILNFRFAFFIKVVEQMNLGLIVVANETHGTRAFIEDGKNGVLAKNVEGGISKALERAICMDQELVRTMSISAMNTVKEHRWPVFNKRLAEKLKRIIEH